MKQCLLFIILLSVFTISCTKEVQKINSDEVQWTAENVVYGVHERQSFSIILPKERKDVHAVVYIHGSAFFMETSTKYSYPLFLTEFSDNNIFATVGYRLVCVCGCGSDIHYCDMLSDVHNALVKIREYANDKGYNVKDFILVGHSAGANLALMYSYNFLQENDGDGVKIAAVVSMAGPTDFSDNLAWFSTLQWWGPAPIRLERFSLLASALAGYPVELTQSNWTLQDNYEFLFPFVKSISPVMHVRDNNNIPPTLIIHADAGDVWVPFENALSLNTELRKNNITHKFIIPGPPANNHILGGVIMSTPGSHSPIIYPERVTWIDEAKEWIRQFLD